jgi:hypothetical protein
MFSYALNDLIHQRMQESWRAALHSAETHFRNLITTSSTSDWKRISTSTSAGPNSPAKRVAAIPDTRDVIVHRKVGKAGDDIYRIILDLPIGEGVPSFLEPWKVVLMTPELRQEWDPVVQESHLLEVFDESTRIYKTNFGLGWPARCVGHMFPSFLVVLITCPSPRDAVTISRSFHDPSTFLQIATSLPRSPDEPAYLRPSPPFVRSNVTRKYPRRQLVVSHANVHVCS